MKENSATFELFGAGKQFGGLAALHDISLRIDPGERVALVGPSGAGKSTLISLLNGTQVADVGRVCLLGQDVAGLNARELRQVQRRIGTVYQQFHLVENLAVVHNVNAGRLGGWSLARAAWSLVRPLELQSAYDALTRVGIPEKLYERTGRLSGGQQQRVALARVLVQNPDAILADEPIASLDPERSREIMDLLSHLAQEMGKTLVTSVHAIEYAYTHFERIIGLRQGRVLFDAAPQEVSPEQVQALYRITD
ncbi:MAG: phosphonate ABC transporter ATP-binding protein [Candidatus Promineifilaceae bacterium]|nr:phosphonate ABC transporter ATP-binding protein [Candidatus Promineifilaceae bacterium]